MEIKVDKKTGLFLGVIATLLVVIVALLTLQNNSSSDMGHGSHGGMGTSAAAGDLTGSEVMFLQMMIPHHQQAVDISNLALKQSSNPELLALAKIILKEQSAEITQMNNWLSQANAGTDPGHSMDGMAGMLSDSDLMALESSTGKKFDELWLTGMIAHHDGAVDMVGMINDAKNPEIKSFGENVIKVQLAEIAKMRELLNKIKLS